MENTHALLIGAALIAVSVLATNGISQAKAAYGGGGPYQLMQHSNTVANAGVFRLDTTSGGVSYCYISGSQALTCTGEIK